MAKRRIVSGMRPTGKLHLGHLRGALLNWKKLQEEFQCFYFIADWHALTSDYADTKIIKEMFFYSRQIENDWKMQILFGHCERSKGEYQIFSCIAASNLCLFLPQCWSMCVWNWVMHLWANIWVCIYGWTYGCIFMENIPCDCMIHQSCTISTYVDLILPFSLRST